MDVFSNVAEAMRPQLEAAARAAAVKLGLPALLAEPRSVASAAKAALASPHRLEALLDVLALAGDVERSEGTYRWARPLPMARPPPTPPATWGLLAEVLRRDAPLYEPGVSGAAGEELERFHRHLCSAGSEAAAELARTLLGLAPEPLLLDLGSGAGAYSAALLAESPVARSVLFDRPAVLSLARAALAAYAPRAMFLETELLGDWPGLPAGARPNLALLANLLHLFGPEESQQLVDRAAAAVGPGGWVVVKDLRLQDDRSGPPAGVLFSLNMALFTERGRVHTDAALRAFLQRAGLVEISLAGLAAASDAVVAVGRVPSEPRP